jgi:hypothetical protein
MWDLGSESFFFFFLSTFLLIAACLDQWVVGRLLGEIFSCFDFFVVDLRSKLVFEIEMV